MLSELLPKVISLSKTVGEFIRTEKKNFSSEKIEVKGLNDLVSYVDKTSEQKIVNILSELLPEAGFIVEENTRSERKEYNWIVDPLDGTTNFIHGVSTYAVSIALEFNSEILLGVVYEVSRDECFYALKNGGAFLNEQPIKVTETALLKDSLIATGFPVYNFDRIQPFFKTLEYFLRNTHGARRIGAAAVDLCYVACGRVDAFFEYNLSPWDLAAGALIVKEAGGKISDFSGGNNWLFGKELIASNANIYNAVTSIVKANFVDQN
ncbi:MAG: inositol monophosphatase family protein [Bacteroidota bacterium]|nr:inositol monophosphatase family protein [Bacteroidota bacterium]